MYILITFLLLATCNLSTSIGIYNKENSRLQGGFQSDEFFQKIRDWFANIRNRIHDRLFPSTITTPPPLSAEILNFDQFELQNILKNREWLPLDLSALPFNPNQDWGFRVGNWYFIQKGFRNQNGFDNNFDQTDFQLPNNIQPKNSAEVESEETFNVVKDSGTTKSILTTSTTTILSMNNVTPTVTQKVDPQTTTEQTDSHEYSSPKTDEQMEDNETDNDFIRKGSAEVLMG
ncbi:hypothetical protein WH47_05414 [Habropoda laboriosa]|uniref:Uncharacterized protein n=1 Tax=Habropoda laboriosa TaxID=597456 RepID=A0A0L7QTV8_9HYME|nr:PREDICTED: uncharacterized protein LOC108575504 [Habropoda laboriosa]KOC61881.1 hypothetical protein WH47_05414 [Habropoda laboriosa]